MAWDFSTDPEFEKKLQWMRAFVDAEILPLETIEFDVDDRQWATLTAPLKDEVRRQGLWACHLDPELGGQGYGQVKLALMHEILGRVADRPGHLRQPGAGFGQRRAARHRRRRRAEATLVAAPARRPGPLRLLDDRAGGGRLGSDPHPHEGGARRGRVRHQRPQVVHLQRIEVRLPDRDGRHQPRRPRLSGLLDDRGAHQGPRRQHRPGHTEHAPPLRPSGPPPSGRARRDPL